MGFSIDEFNNMLSSIKESEEIQLAEIPCVDLYMDQVTTLFDDKLKAQKRNSEDVILTKTMINNYAKAKILPPIKNKKYTKQQIILLILIYNLKQILSLEDIKTLFDPVLEKMSNENTGEFLDAIYKDFLIGKKDQQINLVEDFTKKIPSELSFEDDASMELLMLVLNLISNASLQKRIAEKIIDEYFKRQE